jgi:hypothetical protein
MTFGVLQTHIDTMIKNKNLKIYVSTLNQSISSCELTSLN